MKVLKITTAVDDIERKEPTNTPSGSFAPHNYKVHKYLNLLFIVPKLSKAVLFYASNHETT